MERHPAGNGFPIRLSALRWLFALVALLGAAWSIAPAASAAAPDADADAAVAYVVESAAPTAARRRRPAPRLIQRARRGSRRLRLPVTARRPAAPGAPLAPTAPRAPPA